MTSKNCPPILSAIEEQCLIKPVNGLYTFGQPRTGDRGFAKNFDADFEAQTFRYVNNNDIVPRVPFRMDATILVTREGRTTHQALASGAKRLRQSRARILGAVLNAVVERFGNYYRYHRYEPSEKTSIIGRSHGRGRSRHRKQA